VTRGSLVSFPLPPLACSAPPHPTPLCPGSARPPSLCSATEVPNGRAPFSLFSFPFCHGPCSLASPACAAPRPACPRSVTREQNRRSSRVDHRAALWQNRPNYPGSSALAIAIQPILTQRTSNGTTHWSVGSPPDATTVQQDRSRFTSHEGEFTITQQLINF
jgi:hypothetical protein